MTAEPGDGRPFVGRVETVEALHRRFEDARAGHGGVTILVGETGVGKTELVHQVVTGPRDRTIRLLEARASALDAPPPFDLIRSALASAARDADPAGVASESALPAGFLIGFAPRLDDGVGATPVHVEERLLDALGSVEERGETSRLPLLNDIATQFLEFTRRGPAVLLVEDLHRADEPSLGVLEHLARQLQNRPLWILGTSRPPHQLPEARRLRLEAFQRATHAERIALRPMSTVEVAEYLKRRNPERTFSEAEVARWHSESGGNPLLLDQLERHGEARTPAHGPADPEAPVRVPALDEVEERVVAAAAVLGAEFSFALLMRATGEEEERLAETVDSLVDAGVLLELRGERLTFADERLRSRLYDGLTESRRRLLHRRAGEALETGEPADLPTVYALARHYYLGKVDEKAINYNRSAAEIASRSDAPEVAVEHLERALDSYRRLKPDDWAGETELVLELAQNVNQVGRLEDAEHLLKTHLARRGLKGRVPPQLYALAQLYLARIRTDRGEWHDAEKILLSLLSGDGRAELEPHPNVLLAIHRLLGEAHYYAGRYAEAIREHTEELRLADRTGNERLRALGEVRRASAYAMTGETGRAITEVRKAAATLERLGDAREASHAHLFLGVVIANLPSPQRRYAEAMAELEDAVRLGERAHDPRRVGWALFNSADVLQELGRFDEAEERNQRSREILERVGDRFGIVQARIVQGKIHISKKEYEPAEVELLDAYRLVRELKAPADEVDVVLRLAQLSHGQGDLATARRRVGELERHEISRLRPDLKEDFDRLKSALEAKEAAGGPAK